METITPESFPLLIKKMTDNNPGAANVIEQLIMYDGVDKKTTASGGTILYLLNDYEIYGTDLYVFYNDICDRNLEKMLAVVLGVFLKLFDKDVLKDACSRQDYSGKNIVPVDDLYEKVNSILVK